MPFYVYVIYAREKADILKIESQSCKASSQHIAL